MDWLRQLPIGQFVDEGGGGRVSWLRGLDPRLKLAWTLAFLVTPVLAGPLWRVALVGLLLVLTLVSGLPPRLWRRSLPLLLTLALLVGLLAALLPAGSSERGILQRPPEELQLAPPAPGTASPPERSGQTWELVRWGPVGAGRLSLGPLVVTRRSADLGLKSATLLVTLIHSANLMLLTTPPEELAWAVGWWLAPLTRLGLPMERLGFLLLLALRFLPLVQEELQNLLRALATRAVTLRALGWKSALALVLAVGERLLANILLRSEQGAEALLARGGRWLALADLPRPAAASRVPTLLGWLVLAGLLGLRWRFGAY